MDVFATPSGGIHAINIWTTVNITQWILQNHTLLPNTINANDKQLYN